jgi:hypothetical protein
LLDGFVLLSIGLNLDGLDWTPAVLWLAVVASGLYHGVNPGMGWPLAVSAGLMERSSRALVAALWPLTVGHIRCASTPRNATTPSRSSSAPATIRSLNRALVTASTRGCRPARGRSFNAVLFIAVMPFVSRCPAQPSQPRRFLVLKPLEHVRDHQNPLADSPALASRQAPQLGRPRFAAKKVCRHRPSPKHSTLAY